MKTLWKIMRLVVVAGLALGAVLFVLDLVMDADLVRIADTVFASYDLAKIIATVQNAFGGLLGIFGL